jgi:hypothetical protein
MAAELNERIKSLEETLETLKLYQSAFEHLPFPVVIINTKLEILDCNDQWEALEKACSINSTRKEIHFVKHMTALVDFSPEARKDFQDRITKLSNHLISSIEFEISGNIKDTLKSWLVKGINLPQSNLFIICLIDFTIQKALSSKKLETEITRLSNEDINRNKHEEANVEKAQGHFSNHTRITAKHFGLEPLKEANPDFFTELVIQFDSLVDQSLEFQMYKENPTYVKGIRDLASDLGSLNVSPQDVIDIYLKALRIKSQKMVVKQFHYYSAEARLVVLELMGHLVSFYRNYSFGLGKKTY